MTPVILSADHVSKKFVQGSNEISVLHDITASFQRGKSYAIMGVSGTGKSTLMHILAGLDTPSSGEVFFNGIAFSEMPESDFEHFLNKKLGFVFQVPYLIRELSVIENIIMPGLIAGLSHADCMKRGRALLRDVGIADKEDQKPASLSGGQQQRVALARALFNSPAFLIADEPTGSLDSVTGALIIELLSDLQKRYGMGIIVSTHDAAIARRMDYQLQLKDGHLSLL